LAGILDAKQYFTGTDPVETQIRALADSIYRRMDWEWFRNFNTGIQMEWTVEHGFRGQWVGYNEASIMYILALGSQTHPIDYTGWQTWTQGYSWQTWYGQSYVNFPPLFGHQYSHCWIDFRNIADDYMRGRGITYFENSRRATLAQRAYCAANPGHFVGYSDSLWGITASDYPGGYNARGAPPGQNDDGTIAPTAPGGSIAFAPAECIRVLRNLWENYRPQTWTQYGFRDAFNLSVNWFGPDVIGIDQGPIIIMIENYRTQKVWNRFMQNPDVQRGLQAAGFLPVTDVRNESSTPNQFALSQNYPNPFNPTTNIRFRISNSGFVSLKVYDVLGREVSVLVNDTMAAGNHNVTWDATNVSNGIYFCKLAAGAFSGTVKMILIK
jgi:hypothetical protein